MSTQNGQPQHNSRPPDPGGRPRLPVSGDARAAVSELLPAASPNNSASFHDARSSVTAGPGSANANEYLPFDGQGRADSPAGSTPRASAPSPAVTLDQQNVVDDARDPSDIGDPRTFHSEDPAMDLTRVLKEYTRNIDSLAFMPDGTLCPFDASPTGSSPRTTKYVTLEQRVNIVRAMRLLPAYLEDVRHFGQSRPRIKNGIVVLIENVANRVDHLLGRALQSSPRAINVRSPYSQWHTLAIVPLGETFSSAAEAGRAFRQARDWISHVASLLEYFLDLREFDEILDPPQPIDEFIWGYAGGTPLSDETIRRSAYHDTTQATSASVASARAAHPFTPDRAKQDERPWTPKSEAIMRRAHREDEPPELDFYTRQPVTAQPAKRRVTLNVPPSPLTPAREPLAEVRRASGFHQTFASTAMDYRSPGRSLAADVTMASTRQPVLVQGEIRSTPYQSSGREVSGQLDVADATPSGTEDWRERPPHLALDREEAVRTAVRNMGHGHSAPYDWETVADTPVSRLFGGGPTKYAQERFGRSTPIAPVPSYGFKSGPHGYPTDQLPPTAKGPGDGPPGSSGPGSGRGPPFGGPPDGGPPGGPPGRPPGGFGPPPPPPPPPPAPPAAPVPDRQGPRMDGRLKPDKLPSWDGDLRTVLEYFNELRRWAELSPAMHEEVGFWAPLQLRDSVAVWWADLADDAKVLVRTNTDYFIAGIRHGFLTDRWLRNRIEEYNAMEFRDAKHPRESPAEFLRRRSLLCSALFDYDQRQRVVSLLARAPYGWINILSEHNCPNVNILSMRATELEAQLLVASGHAEDLQLEATIRKVLGRTSASQSAHRPTSNENTRFNLRQAPPARAHLAAGGGEDLIQFDDEAGPGEGGLSEAVGHQIEVYLSLKQSDRDSKGPVKYPFPRSDWKSKKAPPSDCRACGGPHWNKECRHYEQYLELRKTNPALIADVEMTPDEDFMYSLAYQVFVNTPGSAYSGLTPSMAMLATDLYLEALPKVGTASRGSPPPVSVKDEEDESVKEQRDRPKLPSDSPHILDENLEPLGAWGAVPDPSRGPPPAVSVAPASEDPVDRAAEAIYQKWFKDHPDALQMLRDAGQGPGFFETTPSAHLAAALSAEALLSPGADKEYCVPARRRPPAGMSSVGISVLSARGIVASRENEEITLRLDSGASISLVAEDYLKQLKAPPKIRTGLKVSIAQLTNRDTRIKGYVELPIWIVAEDGTRLKFLVELYVVPDMTVEILLGEDFHFNYELNVLRNVDLGTRVTVGRTPFAFTATSTSAATDAAEIVARSSLAFEPDLPGYLKRKQHKRNKANRHRRLKAHHNGAVRAWKDVLIPAETTVRVPIAGNLKEGCEWYVERFLVPQADETFLTVPNTLLDLRSEDAGRAEDKSTVRRSYIAVANPTKTPRILRAGTLVGYAKDPQEYLDRPVTQERLQNMTEQAQVYAALVREFQQSEGNPPASRESSSEARTETVAQAPRGDAASHLDKPPPIVAPNRGQPSGEDERLPSADELPHPAAAEAPDPTIYPSDDLENILDISPDVPRVIRDRALQLFRDHILAFGFDGRLGHLEANAKVRTRPDVLPVSEPMHGASPEKRAVIEEQLDKWFKLGVIEPSESPWAAPVVIVYRNGKARFCVDYRKLNALTIADEFPIPRQADILSALSGSQVLSTLDALAGFNQLEIAPDDVEKTAFRTHKGLFQFLRMPFGLRNGPAIFQRIMQNILSPYLWLFVLVYIDDIVIYSANYDEHLVHLDKVLGVIERSGLTLSPNKCHFLYSSILLLGHKVSRLGLSTHEEKVSAILDLEPPKKIHSLQMFLGMVVYFQAFIPYYSFIVAPLFKLLKKGAKWVWGEEQAHAFEEVKAALQRAPVLGHPIRGRPYRLYTDASDEALGACLQQVQDIHVRDLKGTPAYERLRAAHASGAPVPSLTIKVSAATADTSPPAAWGATLDETIVETERVISYWSRTFKDAERNYSATEREALAAKEALVKFQPFIEGEKVILITDHSALQWARTFENANRRLASWGLVFSAYPGLEIVHRAGRLHSNVDPLSRLPRDPRSQITRGPPVHVSPAKDTTPSIRTDYDLAELRERAASNTPAPRMAFADLAFGLDDLLDGDTAENTLAEAHVATRKQTRQARKDEARASVRSIPEEQRPATRPRADAAAKSKRYEDQLEWKNDNPPPTLQVFMSPELRKRYVDGYTKDESFATKGGNSDERSWYAGNRFYKDKDGLLFFRDANFMPRLCVPKSEQPGLLRFVHESAFESAHAGATKLLLRLTDRFYWPKMKKDVDAFCASCDVCQKTKDSNFGRYGRLQPHDIPEQPYERISLDLVTGLPLSGGYNAILVIVDRLTKHAQFIPTDTGLDTVRFAQLFVQHVVSRFGVPLEMIADRDGRWLSRFFEELAKQMGMHMLLSSSHHPQHDGQTERTNRTMETMLRHYATEDPGDWVKWLPAIEFAYNSNVHTSTGYAPYFLLYGFHPRAPTDLLAPKTAHDSVSRHITAFKGTDDFLKDFEAHRQAARDAVALAQHQQAQAYNSRRRELVLEPGQLVLLRPRTLELVESQGEGVKLMQKAVGPFAVQERVSDATYRIDLPDTFPMSNVIHLNHLRKYEPSPPDLGERATLRAPRWHLEPSQEYQVEKLVAHRNNRSKGQLEYLVRWEGFGPEHDSWLTAKELRNAPARLIDYKRHHGL